MGTSASLPTEKLHARSVHEGLLHGMQFIRLDGYLSISTYRGKLHAWSVQDGLLHGMQFTRPMMLSSWHTSYHRMPDDENIRCMNYIARHHVRSMQTNHVSAHRRIEKIYYCLPAPQAKCDPRRRPFWSPVSHLAERAEAPIVGKLLLVFQGF